MSRKQSKRPPQPAMPEPAAPPLPVARLGLAFIIGAYLLMALAAAVIVPYDPAVGGKVVPPDETAHWQFICELADGKGLPVFSSGGGNYEAHQPPLFYASALWARWLGGDSGMYLARVWCALLGGLTLLVAWAATRYLLGEALWPRLAAVGALAFVPGRLFIVSSVSNDALFELLSATTLLVLLRGVSAGMTAKRAVMLGACLGAALLTKTSALVLAPVVGLGVLVGSVMCHVSRVTCPPAGHRSSDAGASRMLALRDLALVAVPVVIIWGWWVARNYSLYGEPLAMETFERVFIKDRATPDLFLSRGMTWGGYWQLVAWQTWMSLWGVFGQATVYMPGAFYKLGGLVAGCGGLGLVRRGLEARREGVAAGMPLLQNGKGGAAGMPLLQRRACWALGALVVLLALASFVQFNAVFYQAQGRYFLGASVVMASALAAGVTGLAGKAGERFAAVALVLVLAAMSVWAIWAHVTGGYTFAPPGV